MATAVLEVDGVLAEHRKLPVLGQRRLAIVGMDEVDQGALEQLLARSSRASPPGAVDRVKEPSKPAVAIRSSERFRCGASSPSSLRPRSTNGPRDADEVQRCGTRDISDPGELAVGRGGFKATASPRPALAEMTPPRIPNRTAQRATGTISNTPGASAGLPSSTRSPPTASVRSSASAITQRPSPSRVDHESARSEIQRRGEARRRMVQGIGGGSQAFTFGVLKARFRMSVAFGGSRIASGMAVGRRGIRLAAGWARDRHACGDPGPAQGAERAQGLRGSGSRLSKGFQPDLRAGIHSRSLRAPRPHTLILKRALIRRILRASSLDQAHAVSRQAGGSPCRRHQRVAGGGRRRGPGRRCREEAGCCRRRAAARHQQGTGDPSVAAGDDADECLAAAPGRSGDDEFRGARERQPQDAARAHAVVGSDQPGVVGPRGNCDDEAREAGPPEEQVVWSGAVSTRGSRAAG